ncbi:unnamed protein product [Calicophoron daubneyi]|uniref:Succinate dehydrogenase [ubiquinone] cytochrome b small subunit n=1 Tax=Calicophoron daubneyi TaxID=300641 RepID=A0AAV2TV25_CALDB
MSLSFSLAARAASRRLIASQVLPMQCRTIFVGTAKHSKIGTAPAPYKSGMLPSVHWTIERVVMASMVPLYPAAIFLDTPVMNFLVVATVSLHAYWGLGGVISDYAMERRYGPKLMPLLKTIWLILCSTGFAGLLYFNYNDVGFVKAVKKLWSV